MEFKIFCLCFHSNSQWTMNKKNFYSKYHTKILFLSFLINHNGNNDVYNFSTLKLLIWTEKPTPEYQKSAQFKKKSRCISVECFLLLFGGISSIWWLLNYSFCDVDYQLSRNISRSLTSAVRFTILKYFKNSHLLFRICGRSIFVFVFLSIARRLAPHHLSFVSWGARSSFCTVC